jgi:hypothetical protein
MRLRYEAGTIVVDDPTPVPGYLSFDGRSKSYRSEEYTYSRFKSDFPDAEDSVFSDVNVGLKHSERLRAYQKRAVDLWSSNSFHLFCLTH